MSERSLPANGLEARELGGVEGVVGDLGNGEMAHHRLDLKSCPEIRVGAETVPVGRAVAESIHPCVDVDGGQERPACARSDCPATLRVPGVVEHRDEAGVGRKPGASREHVDHSFGDCCLEGVTLGRRGCEERRAPRACESDGNTLSAQSVGIGLQDPGDLARGPGAPPQCPEVGLDGGEVDDDRGSRAFQGGPQDSAAARRQLS